MTQEWQLPPNAIQRYLNGESANDLAKEYGTSRMTLTRRLNAVGIQLRPTTVKSATHRAKISQAKQIPLDENVLEALAFAGLSCEEIAQNFGVSNEHVRRTMIRLGISRLPAKARPERNYFWNGGRTVDKDGYILVHSPEHPFATEAGYVREHRLVMEQQLNRFLTPIEVVDHIDGNPSNNDPSNLRVFATNADHLRATLSGRTPNWTEDGKRRIQEGIQRSLQTRAANHMSSENDVDQ